MKAKDLFVAALIMGLVLAIGCEITGYQNDSENEDNDQTWINYTNNAAQGTNGATVGQ
jgi:hypothetical protein